MTRPEAPGRDASIGTGGNDMRGAIGIVLIAGVLTLAGCAGGGAGGGAGGPAGRAAEPEWTPLLGTWSGPAYVEEEDIQVTTRMTFAGQTGVLTGTFSVPEMMVPSTSIQDLAFGAGMVTGWVYFASPDGLAMRIHFTLRLDGEALNGTFDSDMVGGVINLRKEK
jgi:hypothetical protein